MKRYIFWTVAMCMLLLLSQQNARAQFVISAGYDHTQYVSDSGNDGTPFDGFSAGIGYTAKFAKDILGFSFGVEYQFNTRSDESLDVGSIGINVSSQEQYIEVPLNFVVDIPVSKAGIILYGGGYAAYGLSGIRTYELTIEETVSSHISYDYFNGRLDAEDTVPGPIIALVTDSEDDLRYRKFEYGVQAGAGVRMGKNAMIHGLYRHGLSNRNTDDSADAIRRNGFSVRLSFLF